MRLVCVAWLLISKDFFCKPHKMAKTSGFMGFKWLGEWRWAGYS
jgi:hypothetical protein